MLIYFGVSEHLIIARTRPFEDFIFRGLIVPELPGPLLQQTTGRPLSGTGIDLRRSLRHIGHHHPGRRTAGRRSLSGLRLTSRNNPNGSIVQREGFKWPHVPRAFVVAVFQIDEMKSLLWDISLLIPYFQPNPRSPVRS